MSDLEPKRACQGRERDIGGLGEQKALEAIMRDEIMRGLNEVKREMHDLTQRIMRLDGGHNLAPYTGNRTYAQFRPETTQLEPTGDYLIDDNQRNWRPTSPYRR